MSTNKFFLSALLISLSLPTFARAETAAEKLRHKFNVATESAEISDFDAYRAKSNQRCAYAYLDDPSTDPVPGLDVKVLSRTIGASAGSGPLFPPSNGKVERTLFAGVLLRNGVDLDNYFDLLHVTETGRELVLSIDKSADYEGSPIQISFRKADGLIFLEASQNGKIQFEGYCYRI